MRISDWSSDVCSSDLDTSAYDVDANLVRSVQQLKRRLLEDRPLHAARVDLGDARDLALDARSVDAIVTSPPYLNAIDYMRGHRMSLVWLGYRLDELRTIRSKIGRASCRERVCQYV